MTNVFQAHFLIWQIRNNDCTFKFEVEEYLGRIDSNEILENSRVSLDIDREKITLILRLLKYARECGIEIFWKYGGNVILPPISDWVTAIACLKFAQVNG